MEGLSRGTSSGHTIQPWEKGIKERYKQYSSSGTLPIAQVTRAWEGLTKVPSSIHIKGNGAFDKAAQQSFDYLIICHTRRFAQLHGTNLEG